MRVCCRSVDRSTLTILSSNAIKRAVSIRGWIRYYSKRRREMEVTSLWLSTSCLSYLIDSSPLHMAFRLSVRQNDKINGLFLSLSYGT